MRKTSSDNDQLSFALENTNTVYTDQIKVAGVNAGLYAAKRQEALKRLKDYSKSGSNIKTLLSREPNNQYDPNAIKVLVNVDDSKYFHLGYVPAKIAKTLAPQLDGNVKITAELGRITGHSGFTFGACLNILIPA